MSMAEVMVAMLILAAGSLAVLNLITAGAHSSYRNEQSQVVSDRLQQEMERILQLPYAKVALTGMPQHSNNTSSPAWRVQGTSYAVQQDGTQPAALVYNGGALGGGGSVCDQDHECGVVDANPTPFTNGDVSGMIYRDVVWQDDPTCAMGGTDYCPGTQDLKRVIVAVALNNTAAGGVHRYQEIQAQLSDPAAEPTDNTNTTGPPTTQGTPWTFWLTDTSCNNSTRQVLVGDHLVHSTDGDCSAGTKDSSSCGPQGCPKGAPDLLVTASPPQSSETPLSNYSTDLLPAHYGLLMPKPSSTLGNGCLTNSLFQLPADLATNDPDPTKAETIHKWLSPPMGSGYNISLTGKATLDLWTQSVNQVSYSGNVCIWLFARTPGANGAPADTTVTTVSGSMNATAPLSCSGFGSYYQCAETPWPTGWTELHIPLNFNSGVTLGPSTRFGLAIQVERAGTSGGGMNFLYDEPTFDSRLQVNTTTSQLPF
jgi:hypothetical protein